MCLSSGTSSSVITLFRHPASTEQRAASLLAHSGPQVPSAAIIRPCPPHLQTLKYAAEPIIISTSLSSFNNTIYQKRGLKSRNAHRCRMTSSPPPPPFGCGGGSFVPPLLRIWLWGPRPCHTHF